MRGVRRAAGNRSRLRPQHQRRRVHRRGAAQPEIADRLDLTIKLLGTPAEEWGGGKMLLLEQGVFDDVAMAMMVHPAPEESYASSSLAITDPQLRYTGATACGTAITGFGRSRLSPDDEQCRQPGSTDMGNVSATLPPAIHLTIAINCGDAVNHQPEFAAAYVMPSADRAVCDGALALALTALAAVTDDAQRDRLIGGASRRHRVSRPPPEVHYDRAGFPS